MKKLLVALVTATFALAMTARAADADKPKLTKEQKEARKALIEKYDANKDGKIDKEERAKMTKEDKEKWQSVSGGKKKGEKKENESK